MKKIVLFVVGFTLATSVARAQEPFGDVPMGGVPVPQVQCPQPVIACSPPSCQQGSQGPRGLPGRDGRRGPRGYSGRTKIVYRNYRGGNGLTKQQRVNLGLVPVLQKEVRANKAEIKRVDKRVDSLKVTVDDHETRLKKAEAKLATLSPAVPQGIPPVPQGTPPVPPGTTPTPGTTPAPGATPPATPATPAAPLGPSPGGSTPTAPGTPAPSNGIETKPTLDEQPRKSGAGLQYADYHPSSSPQFHLAADENTNKQPSNSFNIPVHARLSTNSATPVMGVTIVLSLGDKVMASGITGPKGNLAFNKVPKPGKDETYVLHVTQTPQSMFVDGETEDLDPAKPETTFSIVHVADTYASAKEAEEKATQASENAMHAWNGTNQNGKTLRAISNNVSAIRMNFPHHWQWYTMITASILVIIAFAIWIVEKLVAWANKKWPPAPQADSDNL